MEFLLLSTYFFLFAAGAALFFILGPRWLNGARLRRQLKAGGHRFSPSAAAWFSYLNGFAAWRPLAVLAVYAIALLLALSAKTRSPLLLAGVVALGLCLLLRQLLTLLPPTYGVTGEGVTVLNWLPGFPLGLSGSGSVFIPWRAVEICAIDQRFIVVLTRKFEAHLVFSPANEEKICAFVDALLRRRGYSTN